VVDVLGTAALSTIKTIYGHQQGAQFCYNPHKPGRPSRCYHSYFMANTRLCLGVEVMSGKDHAARHALPCLLKLRHTARVKTLVRQMQRAGAAWQDAGSGWEVLEASLRLSGWSRERCVVLVRETPAIAPVGEQIMPTL
jgi:hypothetical protein